MSCYEVPWRTCPTISRESLLKLLYSGGTEWRHSKIGDEWRESVLDGSAFEDVTLPEDWQWLIDFAKACQLSDFIDPPSVIAAFQHYRQALQKTTHALDREYVRSEFLLFCRDHNLKAEAEEIGGNQSGSGE